MELQASYFFKTELFPVISISTLLFLFLSGAYTNNVDY